MGSTLLAGLLEKLGFTNIPLRKLSLHQYLMNEVALDSGLMQQRLRDTLEAHSHPMNSGGVSVVDRDSQPPRALTSINQVRKRIDTLPAGNISELYFSCRNLYCDAVIYKPIKSHRDWHIEMTTDIQRFDPAALYDRYISAFSDVRMIHLHRPFTGWINSLASQAMSHTQLRNRLMFFPHLRYADYRQYEDAVHRIPGLHMQFDELFDIPIEGLAQKMAAFLDVPPPTENLRDTSYDLYGKIIPYDIAFKRFDDNKEFLRKQTVSKLHRLTEDGRINAPMHQVLCWLRYILDMLRFRRPTKRASP